MDPNTAAGLAEWRHGDIEWIPDVELEWSLDVYWDYPQAITIAEADDLHSDQAYEHGVLFQRSIPEAAEWTFGMTPTFLATIRKIDKKLQGRILEAVALLCDDPLSERGNTIKRCKRELAGCYRFRIGDYRLIYRPVLEKALVVLVDFGARGSVYDD